MPRHRDDYDDDLQDDRFDDRPRVRRRGDSRTAQMVVAGPATGLMWAGLVGTVIFFIGGSCAFYFGYENRNDPDTDTKKDAITAMVLGVLFTVIGTPYHAIMAYAAYQFKHLTSSSWAHAANIMGLVTVVLFGLCMPTTWAALSCGIWGLVMLSKPQVKAHFKDHKHYRDSDDDLRWDK